MVASLPAALRRSPILQQPHHVQFHPQQQQQQQQQQRHSGSIHSQASLAAVQPLHFQTPQRQQQRRGSYSSFEPLPHGPSLLQEQNLIQSSPINPHAAAASISHHRSRHTVSRATADTSLHHHEPGVNEPSYDPRDPVARIQMLQQQRQRELYFQQQHPHVPGGRNDDNDHFLAAINAVLGPCNSSSYERPLSTAKMQYGVDGKHRRRAM